MNTILQQHHYEIYENQTGYPYERIFMPYMEQTTNIIIEDPYINFLYQIDNLSRFCALAVRVGSVRQIKLKSGTHFVESLAAADEKLSLLKRDLQARGVDFSWNRYPELHDREVRFDNGWVVKVGRGLDIYQKPASWISVEAVDLWLRPCKQTKVDVYKIPQTYAG